MRLVGLGVLTVALSACGDSQPPILGDDTVLDANVDAVIPVSDAGYPGPHPAVPQVQDAGGPVLKTPNVVPIFFAGDALEPAVEIFLGELTTSSYWHATTSEYGVGALSASGPIVVSDTPPKVIDDSQVAVWLAAYLADTDAGWPLAPGSIYVIFYPRTTTITLQQMPSCGTFAGYHNSTKSKSGTDIVYAVLPRCSGLDLVTEALSHELVEASTDPLPFVNPANASVDQDHFIWNLLGGEVGDLCAPEPQSFQRLVGSYAVQRTWSNLAAAAGHDPCVPPLATAYFAAAPVLQDMVTLDEMGQPVSTLGVQVPLGQSVTVPVELFSDVPTSDWSVLASDGTGPNGPAELTFSWDAQGGNDGDTLHLTITRVANGPFGGSELVIGAYQDPSATNVWYGFVEN